MGSMSTVASRDYGSILLRSSRRQGPWAGEEGEIHEEEEEEEDRSQAGSSEAHSSVDCTASPSGPEIRNSVYDRHMVAITVLHNDLYGYGIGMHCTLWILSFLEEIKDQLTSSFPCL